MLAAEEFYFRFPFAALSNDHQTSARRKIPLVFKN
jgi:hypothetical protein